MLHIVQLEACTEWDCRHPLLCVPSHPMCWHPGGHPNSSQAPYHVFSRSHANKGCTCFLEMGTFLLCTWLFCLLDEAVSRKQEFKQHHCEVCSVFCYKMLNTTFTITKKLIVVHISCLL